MVSVLWTRYEIISWRNLLKSKYPADLNIVFFYLSRRVTFQAALLKTLSFFYLKVLQSRKRALRISSWWTKFFQVYHGRSISHVRVISPVSVLEELFSNTQLNLLYFLVELLVQFLLSGTSPVLILFATVQLIPFDISPHCSILLYSPIERCCAPAYKGDTKDDTF